MQEMMVRYMRRNEGTEEERKKKRPVASHRLFEDLEWGDFAQGK